MNTIPFFPTGTKSIYLASPFFSKLEVSVYDKVISYLRNDCGYDVYVPREHEALDAWGMDNKIWGKVVFTEDMEAIKKCDGMLVLNWGMYSDSGTAWEQGFAFGIGKPVVSVRVNIGENDYSLMMENGCRYSIPLSILINVEHPHRDYNVK